MLALIAPPHSRRSITIKTCQYEAIATQNRYKALPHDGLSVVRQQPLKPTSPRKGAGTTVTRNKNLVPDPTTGPAIFVRSRRQWTTISHNRTLQGRCRQLMHKWRIKDSNATVSRNPLTTLSTIAPWAEEFPRITQHSLMQRISNLKIQLWSSALFIRKKKKAPLHLLL